MVNVSMYNNLEIDLDKLRLNGLFVKSFIFKDYPEQMHAGILRSITHGNHVKQNIIINFGLHFVPTKLVFDKKLKWKIDRLQANVEGSRSEKLSESARKEEEKALNSLLYLRDSNTDSTVFADIWLVVTLSSNDQNEKSFKNACTQFKNSMETLGFVIDKSEYLQDLAISMTWVGGKDNEYKTREKGRLFDTRAIGALYPFLDGSISDTSGVYIGHRAADLTAVYKNFTLGSDDKNTIVTGKTGSGKSVLLKNLSVGLMIEGFKGYIYDVDGEYENLAAATDGHWADYTMSSGAFVDPTFIEPPIIDEVDTYGMKKMDIKKIMDADKMRYNESFANTQATVSLLCGQGNFNVDMQNACLYSLGKMWEDLGIDRKNPSTWAYRDAGKASWHCLYDRIKHYSINAKDADMREGCRRLAHYLWQYFDGPYSYIFEEAQDSSWIKDTPLAVFHVASDADNEQDQNIGAVKIVMITHMTWQQIKRDRLKKQYYSFEIFDELQRLIANRYAWKPIYRSITTGRKFNDQVFLGFNDPGILFKSDQSGLWDNTKYKCLFYLEEESLDVVSKNAGMPQEIIDKWRTLEKWNFVFREQAPIRNKYDILQVLLPDSEIDLVSKTRGLD